jgi:hypothetical protein
LSELTASVQDTLQDHRDLASAVPGLVVSLTQGSAAFRGLGT